MYRLFLARRYMLSRPVSWLAMGAIAIAVGALIVVVSVMNGFLEETRRIVRGTTADVIVLPLQAIDGPPARRERYESVVRGLSGVSDVCSRLVRPAVLKVEGSDNVTAGDSLFAELNMVVVLGVDVETELRVTGLAGYLDAVEEERWRVGDASRPFHLPRTSILDRRLHNADLPRVLVGAPRMKALRLTRGQALQIVTFPDGQNLSGDTFRSATETFVIAGAFETGHHTFDMGNIFVETQAFKAWTGTRQEFSELYATVADPGQLDATRAAIDLALGAAGEPAHVESWTDRHRVYLGAVQNERNILAFVLALFVLLTCTITFSMLTMMVQEKTRDIGILSAMGASSGGVGSVFAVAGAWVAGAGGLLGLGAGTLVALNVDNVKNWIESTFGIQIFRSDIYAFNTIPSSVDHALDASIWLLTTLFSILICLVPALRAARLDPVDALRHE